MRPKPAKKGQRRIDAALDALGQMGFAREKVRKTVNHLLKNVYSGDDAWVFLEEDSYRVVIEALLEEQETQASEPPKLSQEYLEALESMCKADGIIETRTSLACLVEAKDAQEVKSVEIAESSCGISRVDEPDNTLQSPSSAVSASIIPFHSAVLQTNSVAVPEPVENGGNVGPLAHGHLVRRRPSCYGWISEDEDEAFDALPPPQKKQAYGAMFT